MIGILGGMGTQAGLDFCSKLAKINRGKADQKYPLFILYNKSNIPDRKQNLKKNSKIGLLATETTIKTNIYDKSFKDKFKLLIPSKKIQINNVNKSIKLVKMGRTKEAEKVLRPAIEYLLKEKCKKIILGCTELPIAVFAYKSFKKAKLSKTFLDPNLILAEASMRKYKNQ